MTPIYPTEDSQESKVLNVLLNSHDWVNKQYFVRTMFLTQAGRAIWNLENKFNWKIEHSDFKDDFGFKSYRIINEPHQKTLL